MIEYLPGGGRIKSKSDDGEIITLEDGSVLRVYPLDRINTASWTAMTYLDVVISEVGHRDRKRGYLLEHLSKVISGKRTERRLFRGRS